MVAPLVAAALALVPGPALVRNVAPGTIPALVHPRLVSAGYARLGGATAVIGVVRGREAHAYPVDVLALHEVVDDVVGGESVAVTWCPLCRTAIAFSRRVDGRVLTFEASGFLLHRNLVLRDRETGRLWPQLTATLRLHPWVATLTTLRQWLREHPRSLVLPIRDARLRSTGVRRTQYGLEDATTPYSAYYQKAQLYLGRARTSIVLGAVVERRPLAVPVDRLRPGRYRVRAGLVLDWRPLRGDARLYLHGRRVPATLVYWFAWQGFYPRTEVIRHLATLARRSAA